MSRQEELIIIINELRQNARKVGLDLSGASDQRITGIIQELEILHSNLLKYEKEIENLLKK